MTTDIKELVGRLKEESPRLSDGSNKIAQPYQWAIDALEAMAGEVENQKCFAVTEQQRAELAEAERDRLKAALEEIGRQKTSEEMEGYEAFDADFEGGWDTVVTNARKALEGDAS